MKNPRNKNKAHFKWSIKNIKAKKYESSNNSDGFINDEYYGSSDGGL